MRSHQNPLAGQRWISDTESDLGLGLVSAVDGRTITVIFPASEQQRTYAVDNAPLSRVTLNTGEVAQSYEHWELEIQQVREDGGLLVYEGIRTDNGEWASLPESQLNSFIQVADAKSRLLNGQIDTNKWFDLRVTTHSKMDQVHGYEGYGLSGARINLIPHQLFIAQKIGRRFAPRALLADEVGLGKTIEACLILHKQLLMGRTRRALIIVPEPLLHQWLVELLRRFNLRFKLFDEERCASTQSVDSSVNPFETEQLILTSLSLFESAQRQQEAAAAGWDLVIIDEAHHIQWNEPNPSVEYRFVARLSETTPGLLLLTATPEQLGERSHFARLKLLDPDRFTDFDAFMQEQISYREISEVIDALMSPDRSAATQAMDRVRGLIKEDIADADTGQLIKKLIDRHGPSRVLFRNTRATIRGFPKRVVDPRPVSDAGRYQDPRDKTDIKLALYPELTAPGSWVEFDPRLEWLITELRRLGREKVLVICALADTVIDLERALRTRHGILAAIFHEGMSVIARDRAAHFFADRDGAQLLLCSEIGSEGRNFQFAQHLVLFDQPLHPDLLEQRIGRLDRIGQTRDVQIHIPYIAGSAQEILFRWYHHGLDAFAQICPVGQSIFEETETELRAALCSGQEPEGLIAGTRTLLQQKTEALEQGRDRLLEISSFDQDQANALIQSIETASAEHPVGDYLWQVFDLYGVEFEDKHEKTYVVRPGEHMHTPHFPALKGDGITATFDRATALAHEDVEFLSWEHPLTTGALDLVLTSDHGKAAVVSVEFDLLPRGSVLAETIHTLELIAPNAPELRRFLGTTHCRLLRQETSRDLTRLAGNPKLLNRIRDMESAHAVKVIQANRTGITSAIRHNEDDAKTRFLASIEAAKSKLTEDTELELQRLTYLRSLHASVRQQELDLIRTQLDRSLDSFDRAQPRLDAVRLIVVR